MPKKELTQAELKRQLHYNPCTGIFTWIINKAPNISVGRIADCKSGNGYIEIRVNGRTYRAHRLAWLYEYGYFPEHGLDHIWKMNRDNKIDNRIKNLREASKSCNAINSKLNSRNTSGVPGVRFRKDRNKWESYIKKNKKTIRLGHFNTKIGSVIARRDAEIKYEFTCDSFSYAQNFIDDYVNKNNTNITDHREPKAKRYRCKQ